MLLRYLAPLLCICSSVALRVDVIPPTRGTSPKPALTGAPSFSRRSALQLPMQLLALQGLTASPGAALAAATGGGFLEGQFSTQGGGPPKIPKLAPLTKGEPKPEELQRLAYGYQRLLYLLANWEKETTICIKGCKGAYESCGCLRDPVIVQAYMGYKSMEDPLFKAGDLMLRASTLISDDDFEAYNAAMEKWNNKADAGNVMAYVSSWGEANPGGGQDQILRFLKSAPAAGAARAQPLALRARRARVACRALRRVQDRGGGECCAAQDHHRRARHPASPGLSLCVATGSRSVVEGEDWVRRAVAASTMFVIPGP
jgi:hypothetical protein